MSKLIQTTQLINKCDCGQIIQLKKHIWVEAGETIDVLENMSYENLRKRVRYLDICECGNVFVDTRRKSKDLVLSEHWRRLLQEWKRVLIWRFRKYPKTGKRMSWSEAMRATLENPTGFENTYFMTEKQEREAFGPDYNKKAQELSDGIKNASPSWFGVDKGKGESENVEVVIKDDLS